MLNKPINRWWTVVAGALGSASGAGVVAVFVLGVFIKSISSEFGWDRSFTTASMTSFYFVSGIGCLSLGSLMARWSIRSVTMVFVALFALSMMAVAFLPNSVVLFCIVFGLMGFFGSAATPMPYAIAIAHQFDRNRGLALALMVSGTAVGAFLLPNYANYLMENHGWRAGYFGVGLLVGLVALSGLTFCFRTPIQPAAKQETDLLSFKELYLSSGPFWLISGAILGISIALVGMISNLAPLLTDRGMTPAAAAAIVGVVGGASIMSRLCVGILLDYVHAKFIAAAIFVFAAIGTSMFLAGIEGGALYLAAAFVGIGIGGEADLITYMTSRYFPAASLSRALGAVWVFWAWGNGIGVFAGSIAYDVFGHYDYAMMLYVGLALLSGTLILCLGKYTFPAHTAVAAPNDVQAVPAPLATSDLANAR